MRATQKHILHTGPDVAFAAPSATGRSARGRDLLGVTVGPEACASFGAKGLSSAHMCVDSAILSMHIPEA